MAKAKKALVSNSGKDTVTVNWHQHMVTAMNAMSSRMYRLSQLLDPRRKIDDECGYPGTAGLTPQLYREMYDRDPIGARVAEVMPTESWAVEPDVYEEEDMDVETNFESAWKGVSDSLRGESWYEGEEGSPIWEMLLRADVLSGIGSYGVLLLGMDDGMPLDQPLTKGLQPSAQPMPIDNAEDEEDPETPDKKEKREPWVGSRRLLFLRAFDESLAEISAFDPDPKSPRYGQPISYRLTFVDPSEPHAGLGLNLTQSNVHWTRVIHIADNLGGSDLYGVPRMRQVWNNLLNLQKLYGGSAEMYWRGAFPGLSLETIPQLGADVEIDSDALKEQMEQYMNGLQRYFSLAGMSAKSLSPQVVDPSPQIEVQLDAICIKLGIPKRIFMGSERGELASTQDSDAWDKRIQRRQKRYITPRIIVPFINRLIWAGVLPEPAESYCVEWPDLSEADANEQADIGLKRTQAMAAYVAGGVDVLIEPQNYLTKVIGFTEDEAEEIEEATVSHVEEGGIQTPEEPVDPKEEAMRDLDIEAKAKSIELMGKEMKPNAGPQFQKK